MDWSKGLEIAWSSVANFVPKLAMFALVLLIGWIVAIVVTKTLAALLKKVGFERLLDRAGTDRWFPPNRAIELITKLAYYFIVLIALQLALTAFGPSNPVSSIVDRIVAWLPQAFVAIVILIVSGAIANAVRDVLSEALARHSQGAPLAGAASVFIIALGIIAALNQAGIGLTVTMPVLIAVLATISGILIVGFGGGLIVPARRRWAKWLGELENGANAAPE